MLGVAGCGRHQPQASRLEWTSMWKELWLWRMKIRWGPVLLNYPLSLVGPLGRITPACRIVSTCKKDDMCQVLEPGAPHRVAASAGCAQGRRPDKMELIYKHLMSGRMNE